MQKYTTEDEEFIRKHYPEMPLDMMSKKLGRNIRAIVLKAGCLGISRNKILSIKERNWSKEEEDTLRRMYPTYPIDSIRRVIKRTEYSITWKASQLRLKRKVRGNYIIRKKLVISPVNIGYIAGLIDGEGYIGILKNKGYSQPRVVIGITDIRPLKKLKDITGVGTICMPKRRPNRKQAYLWAVNNSRDICLLLKVIEPYLIVKKRNAREALAILKNRVLYYGKGKRKEGIVSKKPINMRDLKI